MRTSNSAAVLFLGIIVGCAAERVLVVPPARAGTAPQRWEYSCINANDGVTQQANQFGQQGWELAAAAGGPNTWNGLPSTIWCFKRPLQ
jgi:hypothetical protein